MNVAKFLRIPILKNICERLLLLMPKVLKLLNLNLVLTATNSIRERYISAIKPRDIEILGWCPAGTFLPHGEKKGPL